MRILALETSLFNGSLALLEGERVVSERALGTALRTAQSLAPGISDQLREMGWRPGDIDLVAVSQGPGSFTGLRVGITTAKMFAYAVTAEVIGLNTLDVIADQNQLAVDTVWAVMDAQRRQLFVARYERSAGERWVQTEATQIVDAAAWLESLSPDVGVTGPGLGRVRDRLPSVVAVERECDWAPRASVVGRLGYRARQSGRVDDVWDLKPKYYRKSAAEEKYEARDVAGQDG